MSVSLFIPSYALTPRDEAGMPWRVMHRFLQTDVLNQATNDISFDVPIDEVWIIDNLVMFGLVTGGTTATINAFRGQLQDSAGNRLNNFFVEMFSPGIALGVWASRRLPNEIIVGPGVRVHFRMMVAGVEATTQSTCNFGFSGLAIARGNIG